MIDVEPGVVLRRLLDGHAAIRQITMPTVYILRNQGQNERTRHRRRNSVVPLTDPQIGVASHTIDAARSLIERQRQPEKTAVEGIAGVEIADVDESHELLKV